MTGPELIERAARAIEATMFAPHELPVAAELHEKYLWTARAAIAALLAATREPSEAMILAEGNAIVACEHRGDVWRAAHDALARELGVGNG